MDMHPSSVSHARVTAPADCFHQSCKRLRMGHHQKTCPFLHAQTRWRTRTRWLRRAPAGASIGAAAFNAPDPETGMLTKRRTPLGEEPREFVRYRRQTRINWLGSLSFFAYLCALGFYIWIRITYTLALGPYLPYGCVILGIEMLGATTVILYGINLIQDPISDTYHLGEDPSNPGKPRTALPLPRPRARALLQGVPGDPAQVDTPSTAKCCLHFGVSNAPITLLTPTMHACSSILDGFVKSEVVHACTNPAGQ